MDELVTSTRSIARELNVSRSAVSFVLNGCWREKRISQATHDRIVQHVQAVRFRPNRLALSLKNRRTQSVAIVVPLILGSFYQEILSGVEAVLGSRYTLQLGVSDYDPAKEAHLLETFLENRVDGLLFVGTGYPGNDALLREWLTKRIPLVLLDRRPPKVKSHFVASDNVAVGAMATDHLVETGMSAVYFLSQRLISSATDRWRGYRQALGRRGLKAGEPVVVKPENGAVEPHLLSEWCGYHGLREILRSARPPFGVVATDPSIAVGVLRAVRDAGLAVPRDVAVCSVDTPLYGDLLETPLTHVRQQTRALGMQAAQILLDQMERQGEERVKPKIVLLPGEFVQGKSTRPLNITAKQ
jgi:LacI family transcriptional regulator